MQTDPSEGSFFIARLVATLLASLLQSNLTPLVLLLRLNLATLVSFLQSTQITQMRKYTTFSQKLGTRNPRASGGKLEHVLMPH